MSHERWDKWLGRVKRVGTWGLVGTIGLAGSVAAGFGHRRAVLRPTPYCALPTRDYQFGKRSPEVGMVSMPVLSVQRKNELVPSVKLLQFPRSGLVIDHCSVHDATLELHGDGAYVFTLTAHQNPHFHGPQRPNSDLHSPGVEGDGVDRRLTRTEVTNFEHLLRNEFYVEILVHSLMAADAESNLAPPVLLRITPKPFWVERGKPYRLYCTGCLSGIERYFDIIQTAELRFSYRMPND